MWLTFALAVVASLSLLYVPGFLFCRGVGLGGLSSLTASPLIAIALYCLFGIAYTFLGISCSLFTLLIPTVGLCAIPLVWRLARSRNDCVHVRKSDWGGFCLFIVVALVLGIPFFASALGTPDSVVSEYDNAFHTTMIRTFIDSGSWSILDVDKYATTADAVIAPLGGEGVFYPAAWHILCAMVASLFGDSVALAENAVNFSVLCFVFPMDVAYFLSSIFTSRRMVLLGSLTFLAFVSYPWSFFIWGPLYPNLLAFSLVPSIAGLFVRMVDGIADGWVKAPGLAVFAFGFLSLVFTQPNSIFFCIAALVPYCAYRLWTLQKGISIAGHVVSSRLVAVIFCIFVIAFWIGLYEAPFLKRLFDAGNWHSVLQVPEAIINVAMLKFGWFGPQLGLALLVVMGIVFTFFRREYLWISVVYVFFCIGYVLCASTDGLAKHIIAGFWYCDSYRLAACMAISGIPLAALGLETMVVLLCRLLAKHPRARKAIVVIVIAVFCVQNYSPVLPGCGDGSTAMGQLRNQIAEANGPSPGVHYSQQERAFVDKVKATIPAGSLVVNLPDDGSASAYGINGVRVLYRDYHGYVEDPLNDRNALDKETRESMRIRLSLDKLAYDANVRSALSAIGADYIMILDYGDALGRQHIMPGFNPKLWPGILNIKDDTPGFETVLSEDDMRLYKVVPEG